VGVIEQVFGDLSVVHSGIPGFWELSHLGSRRLDVSACEADDAGKWFGKFDRVMFAITPSVDDRSHGALWQLSCLVLKRVR
jgi:hypothetical protein